MAGFTTLRCNGECSGQGKHKVLCELREGSSLSLGSWERPRGREDVVCVGSFEGHGGAGQAGGECSPQGRSLRKGQV